MFNCRKNIYLEIMVVKLKELEELSEMFLRWTFRRKWNVEFEGAEEVTETDWHFLNGQ